MALQRGSASSFADEVHIVIRKQLSNANEKYKRIGVVGALAMLRTLGHRDGGAAIDDDQGGVARSRSLSAASAQADGRPRSGHATDGHGGT